MTIQATSQVLLGFEEMHVGLRELTCECGCGQTFFQTKVGRARKYVDSKHKAQAYRTNKTKQANKPLIGDTIKELLDYLDSVYEIEHSLEWLSASEIDALHALHAVQNRATLASGINELYKRYCA